MLKKILKLSHLIILLLAIAKTALAGAWEYPSPEHYIDVSGSYGLSGMSYYNNYDSFTYDKKNYPVAGYLSYGKKLDNMSRAEISLGYHNTPEISVVHDIVDPGQDRSLKVSRESYSIFINGYYSIFQYSEMDIYLMAGAGVVHSKLHSRISQINDGSVLNKGSRTSNKGALQVGIGIAHTISENLILHLDYRISHDGASKISDTWKFNNTTYTDKFKVKPTHAALVGVSFKF